MTRVDRSSIGMHHNQNEQRRRNMKILMVLTSHDVLGNTGLKTGFGLKSSRPLTLFSGTLAYS